MPVRAARGIAMIAVALLAMAAAPEPAWVKYFTLDMFGTQLVYYYDPASVVVKDGNLVVHEKMAGFGSTTVYTISVDCARNTFTELETVVTRDDGTVRRVPDSERFTNYPIPPNSSGSKMREMFCTGVPHGAAI